MSSGRAAATAAAAVHVWARGAGIKVIKSEADLKVFTPSGTTIKLRQRSSTREWTIVIYARTNQKHYTFRR